MTAAIGPGVVQRVIFPAGENLDVVPLYVETDMERGARFGAEQDAAPATGATPATAAVGDAQSAIRFDVPVPGADPRRGAFVAAGRRVSFATYFNAFPASYWRRWTYVEQVTLRVRLAGEGTFVVYRSNARGRSHPVETRRFDGDTTLSLELPLAPFVDGGWYWFDIAAGATGATLLEADWVADREPARGGRVSIGITTFNRPEFVVELLRSLGAADEVLDVLDAVYLIDQGSSRARDHEAFGDATKALGERLVVIEQPNLGGSGGFSRAMAETLAAGASDYVLLLDDDVVLEPEGVLRALAFADRTRRPTIVGGHMFSLHDRSVLNAFGETVAPYRWWWGAAPQTRTDHDFGRQGLRHTPWLHRRVDADYNGWWMCLLPTAVVAEIGLSLPVFIKWDDAEYGLRARRAGVSTVSLPGMAVWHVPWHDKNDAVDWQAYYHLRNRLVSALLHSPYERGGRVLAESIEIQVQHLLSMQYSTAALRLAALEDVLRGPEHLHAELAGKNAELAGIRAPYPDAQGARDVEQFPPVRRAKPLARGRDLSLGPKNPLGLVKRAALGALRQNVALGTEGETAPGAALAHQDANWWVLAGIGSALVSSADGSSTAWYRRRPAEFRALARRSAALHARLARQWPQLARGYRAALPEITSPQRWRGTFAGPGP